VELKRLRKINMCGIVGSLASSNVNQDIYDALTIIQHRGQDAAGIMTSDGSKVYLRKSNGLVRDVILERHMRRLKGTIGIGHVRYPTAGCESASESQPFYVNSPYGLSIVHNGNLVNAKQLTTDLVETDLRHLNTTSDSEVLLNVLAYELQRVGGAQLSVDAMFQAITAVNHRVKGAYAAIVMINGYGLLAFRDPNGIRPLVYGARPSQSKQDYMVASETIALDALGYKLIDDIGPGEAVFIDMQGKVHRQQCAQKSSLNPCLFEYIYLARPDSVVDKISIYKSRLAMGRALARKIQRVHALHDIDVVIPIPDTSRTAAYALAQELGIVYSEGFVKNRYIGRTFIMPEQKTRRASVRLKLSAIKAEFRDKNVLLVDDSIVRGTTSSEIIQMARDVGAKKVYFASAAPEVRYPNVYGIDMPIAQELIAHNRSVDEVANCIGADWLLYQDLKDVVDSINSSAKRVEDQIERFEDSIFTGDYITGTVDDNYLQSLAQLRNNSARVKAVVDVDDQQDCGISLED
jgi:amidophosphoribosyltransferase